MRIKIRQETTYRYAVEANYSMQVLRVQPQDSDAQKVLSWQLSVPPFAKLTEGRDAYDNLFQTLYIDRHHSDHGAVNLDRTNQKCFAHPGRGSLVDSLSRHLPDPFSRLC